MSSDAKLELQEEFYKQTVEWAELDKQYEEDQELLLADPDLDLKCQEMRMGEHRY